MVSLDSRCRGATPGHRDAVRRNTQCPRAELANMTHHPLREWILGAILLAVTSVSPGEPLKGKHAQKHVAAAAPAPPSPPTMVLPVIHEHRFLTPFRMEYDAHLAKTTAATPGGPSEGVDVSAAGPAGPLRQAGRLDSAGVPYEALRPQTPPLVTVGDWNFSADAHLPVIHRGDVGAAISASHGF